MAPEAALGAGFVLMVFARPRDSCNATPEHLARGGMPVRPRAVMVNWNFWAARPMRLAASILRVSAPVWLFAAGSSTTSSIFCCSFFAGALLAVAPASRERCLLRRQ
eukprot:2869114-Prymnesium_polylepis.2